MSKWEKLLGQVVNLSRDLRFEQLKSILEGYGYAMRSGSGSHAVFFKKNRLPITIPRKHPIKVTYIKMVKKVVESGV